MLHFKQQLTQTRHWTLFFIISLIISGLTAFAVETGLNWLLQLFSSTDNMFYSWLLKCHNAISKTNKEYPFIAYGFDWLAFAHIIIALFFIGVYKDPVRNTWVTTVGIHACVLVLPMAFGSGYIRQIPWEWTLVDCSFGIIGLIPLYIIRKKTILLQDAANHSAVSSQRRVYVKQSSTPGDYYSIL